MKLFEKIHASYFSFIGLLIFVIGLIPAILIHTNFSFFSTHVSDLGIPSNNLHIFFNVCWFITGIFMIIFLLGFTYYLKEKEASSKSAWIAFIFSFLSAVGILGLAIFNYQFSEDMHLLAEYLFFFAGILYLFAYAVIENKISVFSKFQVFFNIIVAFFFFLYLVMIILDKVSPGIAPEFNAFSEWLFLFSNLFWFFENGYYMLKHK